MTQNSEYYCTKPPRHCGEFLLETERWVCYLDAGVKVVTKYVGRKKPPGTKYTGFGPKNILERSAGRRHGDGRGRPWQSPEGRARREARTSQKQRPRGVYIIPSSGRLRLKISCMKSTFKQSRGNLAWINTCIFTTSLHRGRLMAAATPPMPTNACIM